MLHEYKQALLDAINVTASLIISEGGTNYFNEAVWSSGNTDELNPAVIITDQNGVKHVYNVKVTLEEV